MQSTLREQLRDLIAEHLLFSQVDQLPDDSSSLEDSGVLDSAGVLELRGLIEQTYRIEVKDDDVIPDNFDSIDGLARFVKDRLNGRDREPCK